MKRQHPLGVLVKGMIMGAADVVPGVSGGTMALITGIYPRLINALSQLDPSILTLLVSGQWRAFWQRIDGGFLLTLLIGIALSIFTLARLVSYALEHAAHYIWGFFFGLLLSSALYLLRDLRRKAPVNGYWLALGTILAIGISLLPQMHMPHSSWGYFIAGAIAICAMILPGISGGLLLLLLGVYQPIIDAVSALDLSVLLWLMLGCITGLLVFSKLLRWLLQRYYTLTLTLMTGFVLGAWVKVWPWQTLAGQWQWPWQHSTSALPLTQVLTLFAILAGAGVVMLLMRWSRAS